MTYYQGDDENPPSLWGYGRVEYAPLFPIIKAPSWDDAGSLSSNSYELECMGYYNPDPKANGCKVARYTSTTSIYVPGDSSGVFSTYIVTPRGCKRENGSSKSCAGPTTESTCKAQSSVCTRTPSSSSSSSSLKCYRQGTTAAVADSECATLSKPQCPPTSGSNPPSNGSGSGGKPICRDACDACVAGCGNVTPKQCQETCFKVECRKKGLKLE